MHKWVSPPPQNVFDTFHKYSSWTILYIKETPPVSGQIRLEMPKIDARHPQIASMRNCFEYIESDHGPQIGYERLPWMRQESHSQIKGVARELERAIIQVCMVKMDFFQNGGTYTQP